MRFGSTVDGGAGCIWAQTVSIIDHEKKQNELIFEIMTQLQVQFKENDHILFHLFDTLRQIILRRK